MELFEAIASRYSYRGPFKDEKPPRDDLARIVDAAIRAPSGCNGQTTSFAVVDDEDLLARIRAMPGANRAVREARACIACITDSDPQPVYHGMTFQAEDCAAAVENMLLAVTALGYATVWIDGWLRMEKRAEQIAEFLDLPAGKTVRIILPIGRPLEPHAPKEKLPFEQRAWFNRYKD